MTLAEIASLIAVFVSLYAIIAQRRVKAAEALERESNSAKLEQEITDKVLLRANLEIEAQNKRIEALRIELQNERAARGLLETKLIEAQQRISALEDELDKRDKRIKELEGNGGSSGTLPTAKPSGFIR